MNEKLQKGLLGFASGVMIAASVWSLLIPAIEMAEEGGQIAWIPAAAGFLLGIGFLLLLDTVTPHQHFQESEPEGIQASLRKTTMLMLAVTLHNIPEGMAVGVTFAGVLSDNVLITMTGAFVSVSYTHLDVYKRQISGTAEDDGRGCDTQSSQ